MEKCMEKVNEMERGFGGDWREDFILFLRNVYYKFIEAVK